MDRTHSTTNKLIRDILLYFLVLSLLVLQAIRQYIIEVTPSFGCVVFPNSLHGITSPGQTLGRPCPSPPSAALTRAANPACAPTHHLLPPTLGCSISSSPLRRLPGRPLLPAPPPWSLLLPAPSLVGCSSINRLHLQQSVDVLCHQRR